MADNQVKLKIGADTSDLEKAFSTLIKKIQSDADKLKLTPSAAKASPGTPGSETFQQTLQSTRAKEQRARIEQQALQIANRALADKERELAKIAKHESASVANEKQRTYWLSERNRLEREYNQLKTVRDTLEKRGGMPLPAGAKGGMDFGGLLSKGAVAAVFGGTAALVVNKVMEIAKETIKSPIVTAQMQGAAIAGTTGQTLSQMQSGQFVYESMFGAEREKAGRMAQTEQDRTKILDTIGTVLGGFLFTERGRAQAFNPEKYSAMQAQEFAQNRNAALQGLKEQDPFKKNAIEMLQSNASGFLQTQRTLGLNDAGLFNYLKAPIGRGFTPQQGMEATSAIMGAGGSTSMGNNSYMALQAQRNLNLNNATGIFGSLSGTMGDAGTSKQALIEIFAAGLDKSKYAAENSRFVQNVAEIINQKGIASALGAAQVSEQMGGFATGATTMKSLENSKAAYEAYQSMSTTTSGRAGAINFGVLAKQFPGLLRAAGGDPTVLQAMIENRGNLDPNSAWFQSHLLDYNKANPGKQLDAQQYQGMMRNAASAGSRFQAPGTGGALDTISQDMMAYVSKHGNLEGYDLKNSPAVMSVYSKLADRSTAYIPELKGKSPQYVQQFLLGEAAENARNMPMGDVFSDALTVYRKQQETKTGKEFEAPPTRALDQIIADSAKEAGVSLTTLAGILGTVAEKANTAATAFSDHSGELQKMYETYNRMKSSNDPMTNRFYNERLMPAQRNYEAGQPFGNDPLQIGIGDLQLQANIGK
jgi:hypothetical protein